MTKALVMPNLQRERAVLCTKQIIAELKKYGIETLMDIRFAETFCEDGARCFDFFEALDEAEVVIAVGGDGTIIHSAMHSVAANKPVLGINVGRLGFMAGLEMSELHLLKKLADDSFHTETRMMLACRHVTENSVHEYLALNDVVVSNGALARIIEFDVYCGNRPLVSYRADGVIFSTPTGSTGYALSAGGPIVEPSLDTIVIVPICPHALDGRAVLFNADKSFAVKGTELNRNPIYITVDGGEGAELKKGESIEIFKSDKVVQIINLNDRTFYEILNQKLKYPRDKEI